MRTPVALLLLGASGALAIAGCQGPVVTDLPTGAPSSIDAPTLPADMFDILATRDDAISELCDPSNDQDRFTDVFCADNPPQVHGLQDLLVALGLDFKDPNGGNGTGGNPGFALLGHSSALTARKVSTIAPTAFVFTPPIAGSSGTRMPDDFVFLAFDPGEHFAEVAANSPDGGLNFYLLLFDTPCSTSATGCTNAETLTQTITTGWSNLRPYEDTSSLGNTIAACAVCHNPQNQDEPILRMQEIKAPFTHWFSTQTEGGRALLADFHGAHGTTEDYGPIPAALIDKSDPALMARAITILGFGDQPNAFDSDVIEADVKAVSPQQPAINVPSGASQCWQQAYDNAVTGAFIAAPYHDVKATDPQKLAAASAAYQAFLAGQATDIPDIRDVLLDSGLRDMGFAPKAGLNGRQLLQQMCQECHATTLDQSISRDHFRVDDLEHMSRKERDLAITRIGTPLDTRLTMPPQLFRTVTAEERALMVQELSKEPLFPQNTDVK